ncbi:MAG: glycosyltransferase family 4 protein [Saprospiraceae bacterium]|nr:glycosyltransferase family 4 protein [Saprospiraceae bacterium]
MKIILLAPPVSEGFVLPPEWSERHWVWLSELTPYRSGPVSFLLGYRQLRRLLLELDLDQLYSFTVKPNILSSWASRGLRTIVVPTITGLGSVWIRGGWRRWLLMLLYRISLRSTEHVVFHNADDLDLFLKKKIILSHQSSVIPGSGVDTKYYFPRSKPAGSPFTVLYIGRWLIDNGLRELVQAASKVKMVHPNVHFLIIGNGSSPNSSTVREKEIQSWIAEGWVELMEEQVDIREWIALSDVVILPSWREGMPLSLLEAMSMERPVITTDVPGCRQLMEQDDVGWLIPVDDSAAIAAAIIEAIACSPDDRKKKGTLARELVRKKYAQEWIVREYNLLSQSFIVHV